MRNRNRSKVVEIVEPTPEQMRDPFALEDVTDKRNGGSSITIGKAYRRRSMIAILFDTGVLDEAQFRALRHYRHHADIADRSLVRDSLCLQRGGCGDGPTITTLNAVAVTRDCEAAAGSLVDILRAVAVYDRSLSQWAIEQAGAVEKVYTRQDRKGRTVPVHEIKPKPEALDRARLEIRMAAERVRAEQDA
jgi:hypothetical protein